MTIKRPDYTNSILNVTNSILAYFNTKPHHQTHPVVDQWLDDSKPNHIIYILLDGLGRNVINQHLDSSAALQRHHIQDITSVYPPTTVAATTSVISGLSPLESGHIGWVQYFKEEDVNVVVFQNIEFFTKEPQSVNLKEKYMSFESIYDQIKKASPDTQTNEFFPSFRHGGSDSFNEEIEKVLLSTHNCDQSFNYVYWIEPDISQHQFGTNHESTKAVIKDLDQSLTSLFDNVTDDTLVIVIADHGLIDVTPIPFPDYPNMMTLLKQQPTIEPRTTTFFVKDGKQAEFRSIFESHFNGMFQLYTKEAFLDSGLLGPGTPHPMYDQTLGDFISVAISDAMFTYDYEPSHKAHHAGLTKGEMMVPLVLYSKK